MGSICTLTAIQSWAHFRKRRAATLWNNLCSQTRFGRQLSPVSTELAGQIQKIYQQDLQGEFFPVSQALQLLDTHHRQQERSQLVSNRLLDLKGLHFALSEKIKELRELGTEHEEGNKNLAQIEADAQALRALKGQIETSCRRLEMILISVQTAFKTRQLQREISDLGKRSTSSTTLDTFSPEHELSAIERQITREVETFLQLERETDRHMREI
ncbi:hypothetical protein [Abditibacterium utsteinense]|uniref:hypothetical protein n=1 Tax=Abditibacterium utsteinense TaxID=1960156 RepID=UPI0013005EBA|nr:hypothetical protein [Abditibacterium utsteinense]